MMSRSTTGLTRAAVLVLVCLLAGCAGLRSEVDPPKVSLDSFKALPSEGTAPRFEIKLRVANPNKTELDIAGISYTVEVYGKELIAGVSSDVPVIAPYSEQVVTVQAGLQLFHLLRLLASLGTTQSDALDYKFMAKIDFNGFVPTQRVEETGQITLGGS
tara:strand:+ start:11793 stop:12269 length:477 start_codon:yes stop_codon:yes gene_type:complete